MAKEPEADHSRPADAPSHSAGPHAESRRRGIARHGNLGSAGGGVRGLLKWISIGLATVLAGVVGIAGIAVASITGSLSFVTPVASGSSTGDALTIAQFDGGFNFLMVGTDGRSNPNSDVKGARADVIVLLHVADDHKSAVAVSFPRDLMVPIPACPREDGSGDYSAMSKQQINSSINYGGIVCTVKTIESLTGIDIPYYAQINFKGVIEMTNAIGGVTVCSLNDGYDPQSRLTLTAGENVLKGKNALAFLRMRHGYAAGSDLARISGQQVYMSALVRKITSEGTLTDPFKLYGLAAAAASNLLLSPNLASLDALVSLAAAGSSINPDNMVFVQAPVTRDPDSPNRVVLNQAPAAELFEKIADDDKIVLNADADTGGAVVTESPSSSAAAPSRSAASGSGSASSSAPASSSAAPVEELPQSITGQTAGTKSCVQLKGY